MLPRYIRIVLLVGFIAGTVLRGDLVSEFFVSAVNGPITSSSISNQSQQGSNNWYVSGVTVTITATPNGAAVKSLTYQLDATPVQTVNSSSTTQTFSQNGSHTLTYFATDVNNVQGPTGSVSFKIDTISPVNWSNITQTRDGNAHTFEFSANVTDATAGLNPSEAYMQYNVDDTGTTWGYYSNPLQCNSTWQANQWYHLATQDFSAGATSGTIETPAVDYCNSSGSGCDFMRVKIADMAGNFSERKICLGSPWLQTSGSDVHSVANISMLGDAPQANTDAIVGSGGSISAFSTSANWYVPNYANKANLSLVNYATLDAKYGATAQSLPSGQLPKTTGVYKVNGNFTVSSTVIPSNYSTTQNFGTIILINGTLTINTNITTDPTAAVVFVVSGGINIDKSVTDLSGVYIATGLIDSSYNGNSNTQLQVKGGMYAQGGFDFARTLGTTTNKTTPAELITWQPQMLLNVNLISLLTGNKRYDWREVAP